jgi:hypothetical protein
MMRKIALLLACVGVTLIADAGGLPSRPKFQQVTVTPGSVRSLGWPSVSPTTGTGVEVGFTGGKGIVLSYNRAASTYQPLELQGSALTIFDGTTTTTVTPDALNASANLTGCTTDPAPNVKVRAFGRLVIADVSASTSCTSNSTTKQFAMTGLPAGMQSLDGGFVSCAYIRALDNGTSVDATVSVNGTTLSMSRTGISTWTASGTWQLVSGFTCSWIR